MPLEEPGTGRQGDRVAAVGVRVPAHDPTGLVLVDKPAGPSSFAFMRDVTRNLPHGGQRRLKAGHAGTLDPAASGLLLVLVGSATRLAQYLVGLDKRYQTEIQLGQTTTTGDAEGEPLATGAVRSTDSLVEELVGELELPVPAASAVKIDGERAYKRFRRGEQIEMPTRDSKIHRLEVASRSDSRVTLDLTVSSGTYIRAIANHLGGHCLSIRRTAVGPFDVADADNGAVVPPVEMLPFLRRIELTDDEARNVRHGRRIPADGAGLVRATYDGDLVAILRLKAGEAQPETVLAQ